MKILLLGEYSNVHSTLARGLRILGHEVTVASNGDFWKDYPRDIDLARKSSTWGGFVLTARLLRLLPKLKGYDIVQLINPMFLELKAEHIAPIYHYLRKHNKKILLGAFGMDYYCVHECVSRKMLRYSDFNIGEKLRTNKDAVKEEKDWLDSPKGRLNQMMAKDCDGIVTGLYEYWACYHPLFPKKTIFIPYPVQPKKTNIDTHHHYPVKIFIGISKNRSEYKGTNIMLKAAKDIASKNPDKTQLQIAEGIPFDQYCKIMKGSDAILYQLYSYTPAMNALEAMSRGIICIGGGEPENYEILHEKELRPILNVTPSYENVYQVIEQLVLHPEKITSLKQESISYIQRHHNYIKVAKEYAEFYQSWLGK